MILLLLRGLLATFAANRVTPAQHLARAEANAATLAHIRHKQVAWQAEKRSFRYDTDDFKEWEREMGASA